MSKVTVYHGTVKVFRAYIEENGLKAADPRAGVRAAIAWPTAREHAMAVSAFHFTEHGVEPVGLIVEAIVDKGDCWMRNGIVRVKQIRTAEITKIHVPVRFPEFEPETDEVTSGAVKVKSIRRAGREIDKAYDAYLKLRAAGKAFEPARSG